MSPLAVAVSPSRCPSAPRNGSRVCVVSVEFNGPCRNGGIGTACTALGEKLAAAGHDVTLLYALGHHTEQGSVSSWVRHFRRRGLRFVPLPSAIPREGSRWPRLSHLISRWLADEEQTGRPFDVVHFHEWLGLGHDSLLAHRQGLAFAGTTFWVGLHSPTRWIREANQGQLESLADLECDALERRCVELADVVWSPSRYLLDWARGRGWQVGPRVLVHPYPLPVSSQASPPSGKPRQPEEVVFFGRLEVRKGLVLFCDALDRLAPTDLPARFSVTFLGKPTPIHGVAAVDFLRERSRRWPFPVRLLTRCNHASALRHLRKPGRLAIMPSLVDNSPLTVIESLALGLPFLASAAGGIPELLAPECHDVSLFAPNADALANRLRTALREGVPSARPAHDPAVVDQAWDRWHRVALSPSRPEVPRPSLLAPNADLKDLLSVVQGQARRIAQLEQQLRGGPGEGKCLRYRLADAFHRWLGRVPFLRPLLRRLVGLAWGLSRRPGRP